MISDVWARQALEALCSADGTVRYDALRDWVLRGPPPPDALSRQVWRLQDEPPALHCLRCVANAASAPAPLLLGVLSFPTDDCGGWTGAGPGAKAEVGLGGWAGAEADMSAGLRDGAGDGLQRRALRVVALRLDPGATDVAQLGWRGDPPRPLFASRTHVVVQFACGRHCAAWAYGTVGLRLRVGAVVAAVLHATRTGDGVAAVVVHNACPALHMPLAVPPRCSAPPHPAPFAALVAGFAPEIAGQPACKALLVLVAAHTLLRATRCRGRRPLHVQLTGAPRSGKSALLRGVLRLLAPLGPRAALVAPHVVRGSGATSGALLLAGAAISCDALVVDERDGGRGGGGGGGGALRLSALLDGLSAAQGRAAHTNAQVTAAVSDDCSAQSTAAAAAAATAGHFALVARTTARLSAHCALSIGDGVIAASVARAQSASQSAARSSSASHHSGLGLSAAQGNTDAESAALLLRHCVETAPPEEALEAAVPAAAFARFYLHRLHSHSHSQSQSQSHSHSHSHSQSQSLDGSAAPLAAQLAVLWELTLARVALSPKPLWDGAAAEDVWQCYAHHVAASHGEWASPSHGEKATPSLGERAAPSLGRRKGGKKGTCVALLRLMAKEQRAGGGAPVAEGAARAFFAQLGGEEIAGQSFAEVVQQLIDAAFIIRRPNAYAVVAEA